MADITGGTMSASSTYGTAVPSRAEDGSTGSEWMADNVIPCALIVTFGSAQTIGSYRVEASFQGNRAPASWTFDGSNDGSSWTTLDTQTGLTWTNDQARTFTLGSSATYSRYRVNTTAKQAAGDGYINIGEFWVQTPAAPTNTTGSGALPV